MNEETSVVRPSPDSPESAQIQALGNMPRDLAVIKMDNDSMIAMAAARPRDYKAIVAEIKSQLKEFPTFAESAVYAKPVGTLDKCPACGADTYYKKSCPQCHKQVPQKIARGLSIRAAEALSVAYKYNRTDSIIEDIDDDTVRLTVSFVDYQTGRVVRDSTIVKKTYKSRKGDIFRHQDDRFYGVVMEARKSILLRNCIMRMVPPGMKSELQQCVEEQCQKFLDPAQVAKIVKQFAAKKVSKEMLEKLIGKKVEAFDQDDRTTLLGVWNAIKDGDQTVEEVFADDDEPNGKGKTSAAPSDLDARRAELLAALESEGPDLGITRKGLESLIQKPLEQAHQADLAKLRDAFVSARAKKAAPETKPEPTNPEKPEDAAADSRKQADALFTK